MTRVVFVDDSKDITDVIGLLLSHFGFETKTALTGEAALRLVREFKPDVVILDILMVPMSGHELARRLRVLYPRLALIALTGLVTSECRAKAIESGIDEFLVKPIDMRVLSGAITRALRSQKQEAPSLAQN